MSNLYASHWRALCEAVGGPDSQLVLIEGALHDAGLHAREIAVLSGYFGLESEQTYTLEAIGADIGFTRERARQIKAGALAKLRYWCYKTGRTIR